MAVELKEVRIRMSGTSSNRNYGNLSPEVTLTFHMQDEQDWDAALQRMVNVTHDTFVDAAKVMLMDFGGYADPGFMLAELGVEAATDIEVDPDAHFAQQEKMHNQQLDQIEAEAEEQKWFNENEDFGNDPDDTQEVDTSRLEMDTAD